MAVIDKVKTLYKNLKRHLTVTTIILFIAVIFYSLIGGLLVEDTPLLVVSAGIHEFGHSLGIMLTGNNLTAIQISANFNNYSANKSTIVAHTEVTYEDTITWLPFVFKISGPLFALIVSILLVDAPYLRWFAPIIGLENMMQITPLTVSTDGYAIFNKYGAIIGSITLLIFIILYLYLAFKFTIYLDKKIDGVLKFVQLKLPGLHMSFHK